LMEEREYWIIHHSNEVPDSEGALQHVTLKERSPRLKGLPEV
jgi:hypothetical protein